MNIQDLKEKFKAVIDRVIEFVIEYKRYFLAGIIFIVISLVLFLGTNPNTSTSQSTGSANGVYKDYKINKNTELDTLINTYYTSYANGDTDTLATIATPISDQEISYIQFYSQYIESFNDIEILTKSGLTDGSYLVTTKVNLKYVDIDEVAPGLDFFYVETNEDGALYINNIYGSFNQNNNIYEMDSDISDLIAVFIRQQDLLDMEAEVQSAYDQALENDANLNTFMSDTLPTAIANWNMEYQTQVQEAEEAAAKAAEEEAAAAEAEAAAAAEAEEEANSYTGTTNAKANVREEASSDSNKLGSVDSGTSIKIYAEEGDFYKFDYNGTKAYITKDAVDIDSTDSAESDDSENEESTDTATSIAEGTTVTLDTTVNIRSQMDSSSSKVAVAYAGEEVTVVMSYAEGWTKVKYGKKEGYIRTDLLQ